MNKPHKWAAEIKAWADGAVIESQPHDRHGPGAWCTDTNPRWIDDGSMYYRIKRVPREIYVIARSMPSGAQFYVLPNSESYPSGAQFYVLPNSESYPDAILFREVLPE